MDSQGKIEYWVYENHHNEYAKGHTSACRNFKIQGGANLPTGRWLGPFDSKAQAMSAGQGTGYHFRWCKLC
jgi:hypothetical protein